MRLLELLTGNPPTREAAVALFSDPHQVFDFMIEWRWPDGRIICPNCGSDRVGWIGSRQLFQCKALHPKRQFSVKVGTVFESSSISIEKWLLVAWLLANHTERISTYDIARIIGVCQKTAWFMKSRIGEEFFPDGLPNAELDSSGEIN